MVGRAIARAACALLLAAGPALAGGADPAASTGEVAAATSAVPAEVVSPQALGLLVGGGTVALILSGHDREEPESEEEPGGLATPALIAPAPDAAVAGPAVELVWDPVAGAASYLVDVDLCDATNGACADLALEVTADTRWTLAVEPPADGRWRIRAVDTNSIAGPYSDFRRFRVTP